MPERLKGPDCKSGGIAYVGSNPTPSINVEWPTASLITEDGDEIEFEYCCWTFCAWPELLRLLQLPQPMWCDKCKQKRQNKRGK